MSMFFLKLSDPILLAIIALGATFLTLLTQIIMAVIQNKTRKEQKETNIKIDGRLTQLLEEKEKSSRLEGHAAGVADQKAETKSEIPAVSPIKLELGKVEVVLQPPTVPPPDK